MQPIKLVHIVFGKLIVNFNALRRARGLHCKLINYRRKAQTENGNLVFYAPVCHWLKLKIIDISLPATANMPATIITAGHEKEK